MIKIGYLSFGASVKIHYSGTINSNREWQRTSHSKDMVNAINRRIEYAKEHEAGIATKGKMIR